MIFLHHDFGTAEAYYKTRDHKGDRDFSITNLNPNSTENSQINFVKLLCDNGITENTRTFDSHFL